MLKQLLYRLFGPSAPEWPRPDRLGKLRARLDAMDTPPALTPELDSDDVLLAAIDALGEASDPGLWGCVGPALMMEPGRVVQPARGSDTVAIAFASGAGAAMASGCVIALPTEGRANEARERLGPAAARLCLTVSARGCQAGQLWLGSLDDLGRAVQAGTLGSGDEQLVVVEADHALLDMIGVTVGGAWIAHLVKRFEGRVRGVSSATADKDAWAMWPLTLVTEPGKGTTHGAERWT